MKRIYFDIMLNDRFVFQLAYTYCPAFKIDMEDVLNKVYEKRPSLRNKQIELCLTDNIVR